MDFIFLRSLLLRVKISRSNHKISALGHFSLVAGHPSCITSQSILNVGALAVSLRICWSFIGGAGRFFVIWWMSNCGNPPSGGAGCGDTLERASAMGTWDPFIYFTVTSCFKARITSLCNLAGQLLSFFLKIISSGLWSVWIVQDLS